MVKASCNSFLWEVYIGVSGQGGAPIGPITLLKINKSPTVCIYGIFNISSPSLLQLDIGVPG